MIFIVVITLCKTDDDNRKSVAAAGHVAINAKSEDEAKRSAFQPEAISQRLLEGWWIGAIVASEITGNNLLCDPDIRQAFKEHFEREKEREDKPNENI